MQLKKIASLNDKYYTGREVQRLLGINEPRLRTLVANKTLRKVTPPGYKTGRYLKSEVDAFAEQWEAFILAKEPPKTVFELAQAEDMESISELSRRAIHSITPTAEVRRNWLMANPENCSVVKHGDKIVAFLHLLPVKHDTLMQFVEGKIRGWEIPPDDIEEYQPGKPLECFAIVASEPNTDEITKSHYMLILIRGVMETLKKLGRRGVIISKIYATSETAKGIAMSLKLEMEEIKPRLGKRMRFVLDTEKTNTLFLRGYKEGLAEWNNQQKKKTD